MAAPKELRSPASAGRPENIKPPVSDIDAEISAMGALSEAELADIKAMGSVNLQQEAPQRQISIPGIFSTPQQMEQFARSAPTVSEVASAAGREFGGMGAEVAGGTAATTGGAAVGGALGAGIGAFMAGPAGVVPGAEVGATVGGFVSGALGTKDLVNFFRKAMSLPEEQDRNQVLDTIAAGAGTVVPFSRLLGAAARTEKNIAKTLSNLPAEDRKLISALQQSVFENAANIGTEKFAIEQRDAALKDVMDGLSSGMNASQATSFMAKKYGDRLQYADKFEKIANRFGDPMTKEELVAAAAKPKERAITGARPGDVIRDINRNYNQEWAKSRKLIANNKDLISRINLEPYIQDLKTLAESATFKEEYGKKINNIISSIENSKAIETVIRSKTMTPDELGKLVIVDAETGKQISMSQLWNKNEKFIVPEAQRGMQISATGAQPQLGGGGEIVREAMPLEILSGAEGQPSFQFGRPTLEGRIGVTRDLRPGITPTPEGALPTEFTPAVTQQRSRLTGQPEFFAETVGPRPEVSVPEERFAGGQEQLALALNQKMEQQRLATLDTIINLRMSLDEAISMYPNMKPKEKAVSDAVTRLRSVEDSAIEGMITSQDPTLKNIGNQAKSTKFALANQLAEEELLGNVTRKDAIGYAGILDSVDPERVGAAARVLAQYPDALNKIAATYLDEKLNKAATGSITGLKPKMADNLADLASGKSESSRKFLANIEILTGDKTIGNDLMEAATLLKRATKVPNVAIKNRLEGQAVAALASKLTRVNFTNPLTYINLIGPDNPQYAQKIVNQLFKNNREAFLDSVVSSPESVLQTIVSLEDLFGRGAAPMTSLIVNRATRQGVLTGAALAALQPGANSTPAPMQ